MANTKLVIPQLGNRFVDDRDRVWGDSYNWSFNRTLNQVKYLVIHHSVTSPYIKNPDGTIKREKTWQEQVDELASLHKARGWAGIGYHLVITTQGIVAYVGDIGTGRANVLNHNEAVIGINLVGDFTKHLPTDAQINAAHDLCDFFLFHYPALVNTDGWEDVIGHKDCASIWNNTTVTACPGTSWPFDMKSRIKDNVIYSPAPAASPQPVLAESPDPTLSESVLEPTTGPTSGESVENGTSGTNSNTVLLNDPQGPTNVSVGDASVPSPDSPLRPVPPQEKNDLSNFLVILWKKILYWFR